MKVREDSYERMDRNFCREYYCGSLIEVVIVKEGRNKDRSYHVGRIITVEPTNLTAMLVSRYDAEPWFWNSEANSNITESFRRLSEKEYMLYKMKGYVLPDDT